jgi:hypothetical protein
MYTLPTIGVEYIDYEKISVIIITITLVSCHYEYAEMSYYYTVSIGQQILTN